MPVSTKPRRFEARLEQEHENQDFNGTPLSEHDAQGVLDHEIRRLDAALHRTFVPQSRV